MQGPAVSVPDWENPAVFQINQRNAHVPLRSHRSAGSAVDRYRLPSKTPSDGVSSLSSSNWAFRLFDRPSRVPVGFYEHDYDAVKWSKVRDCALICLTPMRLMHAHASSLNGC